MPDYKFLPFFITEPVYIVPENPIGLNPIPEVNEHIIIEQTDLVDIQPTKKDIKLKSRGGFKKNILLLVDDPYPEVLNLTDSEFLLKILKAVQLSEDDVAIVNIHSLNNDFLPLLKEHYNYRVMIMFGVASVLTEKFRKYQITVETDAKILFTDRLADIENDKQKKLKLWENLQLLFIMK